MWPSGRPISIFRLRRSESLRQLGMLLLYNFIHSTHPPPSGKCSPVLNASLRTAHSAAKPSPWDRNKRPRPVMLISTCLVRSNIVLQAPFTAAYL